MIRIKNVTKSYDKSKKVVDNLSLDIEGGSIVGFVGHNGAGKSTTIKMMCGILKPDSGTITIENHNIVEEPEETKRQLGVVFDSPDRFEYLKGIEFINFVADIYGVSQQERSTRLQELATEFGMMDVLNNRIGSYSHGMRQKIMVIAALIHNPKVWILDEPLTGLDPSAARNLKNRMRKHADEGNIVFFSTHVLEVAEKLCDKIAVINKGQLVYEGSLAYLQEKYPDASLEDIFFKVTGA